MIKNNCKRILSGLLAVCLLFSSIGTQVVYAVGADGCTCGAENENHASDCALMLEDQAVCTCTPVDDAHQEGCAFCVPAAIAGEPASVSEEVCTCTPIDGVHQEGCAFYAAPTSSGTPAEAVPQENGDLYVMPVDEAAEEIGFSAGIYQDANRTKLLTALTPQGATLSGWTYLSDSVSAEDRYLGIFLSGLSMDSNKQYQLVIEMAPILYINQNNDPSETNTTVSFTRNAAITVNTDGQYVPNTYSLSNLTYLIDSGTQSLPIALPLRFDVNLWNKQDGGKLNNVDWWGEQDSGTWNEETTPLLRVYLQEKQTDGSFETIKDKDVKLTQATVSGSIGYSVGFRTYIVDGSSTATTNMGAEDTMRAKFHQFTNSYTGGHYISDLKIELTIPAYTVGDTTYRLNYKDFTIDSVSGTADFKPTFDEETGVLTITAKNVYTESSLFTIYFSAPDAVKNIPGSYQFTGTLSVMSDGVSVTNNLTIPITVDTDSKAILATFSAPGLANVLDRETVQVLGNLAINNTAAAQNGSGPLWISLDFDVNETKAVAVTTVNIMCDRDTQEINIRYSLVNKDGSPAFPDSQTGSNQIFTKTISNKHYSPGGAVSSAIYMTFTRNDLPEDHSQYYFDTISYTMGNLPGNGFPYNPSAKLSPKGGGTFWGYITTDTVPDVKPAHSITVYRQDADGGIGEQLLAASTTTEIDSGTKSVYGLQNAKTSASVVGAGDSVKISGAVYVPDYPYSSNNCLNNIRLGMVLPAGVTVNEAAVTATYKAGALSVDTIERRPLENGETLYVIKFVSGQKIGYYNEYLKAIESGATLDFSVQLNTDKTISGQPFILRERIFVAGLGQINSAGGSYVSNSMTDIYDLNENGRTDDKVGRFGNTTTASIYFESSPAELFITDELVNTKGDTGASLTMESFADVLTYNLRVECTSGGSASEFYYMIPIARTTMTSDPSVFVEKCQVDLRLTREATVTQSQGTGMKVWYSTTPINGYSETLSLNDWSETLPEGKSWSDVTAIKVVAAEDIIQNGSINVISVPLGYVGGDTDYVHMAGYQIQWSSRGYYHYSVGYNSSSGTKSTDGCTITLTYTPHDPIQFTLTAAKGGTPTGDGAASYSFTLPEFILSQQYSVKQITPYSVTLVDGAYDFSKATSAEANDHFRIKISVKKSQEDTGSTPIALLKENDIIGSLNENSAPEFTFAIENANALSDIVTDRKVTLTLIGSNGVIVPVEITIKRELAAADATRSAIVAGELYAPFADTSTSTIVSCDSAFTAQFVTRYVRANYTAHTLVFQEAPVSGTTITMIDWTKDAEVKYYHYTFEDDSTTSIPLTSFQGMGGSSAFTESTNTDEVVVRLLFIVSFPDSGEAIRENTLKLTKTLKTDSVSGTPDVLTFTTVGKRAFSLSTSAASVNCGDSFTISYTSGCSVTDSRYTDRNLSLVIEPSNETDFPVDARLTVDGTNYYLTAQGNFLIPLKAVQAGTGDDSVTVAFHSRIVEQVSFQVALWASATASGAKPLMGDRVAGPAVVAVSAKTAPSFEVLSMSDRMLERNDLSNTVGVSFKKEDASKVTVELQKKIGAEYVTQTTILESVNGETSANAGQGVFTVSGTTATIKLSSSTAVGTYRLLFTVSSEHETIEVPYNFVVVD